MQIHMICFNRTIKTFVELIMTAKTAIQCVLREMLNIESNQQIINLSQTMVLLVVLMALINIGCEEEQKSQYPYLQFTAADKNKFINYSENTLLTFESTTAENRTYQVKKIIRSKEEYTLGMGFFTTYSSKYYDYDKLSIEFSNYDGKINKWNIDYLKRPARFDSSGRPDFNVIKLVSGMRIWEWNGPGGPEYPINLDDQSTIISLKIGNQTITDVQKIFSGSLQETKSREADRLDWNINTIYFHKTLGVLGFSDVKNNVWLLRK